MRLKSHHVGPIGIDIGAREVRALQLRNLGDRPEVVAASVAPLPAGAESDTDATRAAVAGALSSGKFVGKTVTTCLPAGDVHVKNMRLPNMPEEDLESAAIFEAKERFTELPDDAVIRFIPAGVVGTDKNQQREIIVLAAPAASVEARLTMLTKLRLNVVGLEPGACAFFRPYERFLQRTSDSQQASAFVDIGGIGSRIIITRGTDIVFLKTCPVGGAAFDDLVARALSLETHNAAALRRRCLEGGQDSSAESQKEQVLEAIKPALDQLGKEIGLCLRYCAVTFRGERPGKIIFGGSEAGTGPAIDHLGAAVGLETTVGQALRNMACDDAFDKSCIAAGLPQWTTAVGLALRDRRGSHALGKVA